MSSMAVIRTFWVHPAEEDYKRMAEHGITTPYLCFEGGRLFLTFRHLPLLS